MSSPEKTETDSSLLDDENSKQSWLTSWIPSGQLNASISFVLFVSQLYLTYLAIFGRAFVAPFEAEDLSNINVTGFPVSPVDYGNSVLSLLIILVGGIVCGFLVQLCKLPGLLGMLICGIVLRNVPYTGDVMFVVKDWGSVLRRTAFIVILLRGGLSLDAAALRKLKGACLRLALIPCTVEAVVVAVAARFILGMDFQFGLILGFVLAAVSPAVVVPAMLDASKKGYGTEAGIPTLVVAAASLDDVYAITMFSLLVTVVFSTGSSVLMTVLRAPVEVVSGVFFGTVIGILLRYFPSRDQANLHFIRLCLLLIFSTSMLFGTTALGVDSIGAIAVLVCAFVAGHSWKKEGSMPEEEHLAVAWQLVFQPFLFGLIGFELSFEMISARSAGLGLLVLCIGIVARTGAAALAVSGTGLVFKERLFVALAWLPKATVQAALAPVALDMSLSRADYPDSFVPMSTLIFAVAVLSILTTAPAGAFIIRLCTPRLLKKGLSNSDIELH